MIKLIGVILLLCFCGCAAAAMKSTMIEINCLDCKTPYGTGSQVHFVLNRTVTFNRAK